jgi:hypothetical protein
VDSCAAGLQAQAMVTRGEVHATARAYRTEPQFFAAMGHNMMLEPGWADVAKRIDAWLDARDLAGRAR